MTRVVGLGGGIGASRLWRVLAPAVDLTVVVNTGDDLWHHGLRVCPDLDTTLYALSGRQDTERGWGVRDESWTVLEGLRELGVEEWFALGDRDLATHLYRTGRLRSGVPLSEVTARLAAALGVGTRVLPATDDELMTRVFTAGGTDLHYEEYLVRLAARPVVSGVGYDGAATARPAPGVLDAITAADVVVLAPSNPLASIGPVLAVPGVREAVAAAYTVAVSPIVTRVPIAGEGEARRARARAALLAAVGVPATAAGVAGHYVGLLDRFVLDEADAAEVDAISGCEVVIAPTLLHRGADPAALLAALLG